jgi:hypothetical protein
LPEHGLDGDRLSRQAFRSSAYYGPAGAGSGWGFGFAAGHLQLGGEPLQPDPHLAGCLGVVLKGCCSSGRTKHATCYRVTMKPQIKVRGWGPVDIDNLPAISDPDLVRLKVLIDEEATRIKTQIADAKTKRITSGVYADRDWYVRAERAAKGFGHISQLVQAEFARRKVARRQASEALSRSFARAFVIIAKRRITPELYAEICAEAEILSASSQDGAHDDTQRAAEQAQPAAGQS